MNLLSRPPPPEGGGEFKFGMAIPVKMDLVGTVGAMNAARASKQNNPTTDASLKSNENENDPRSSPPSGQVTGPRQTQNEISPELPPLQHPQPRGSPASSQIVHYENQEQSIEKPAAEAERGEASPDTPATKDLDHGRHDSGHSSTTSKYAEKSVKGQKRASTVPSSMTKPGDEGARILPTTARAEPTSPTQEKHTTGDLETADPRDSDETEMDRTSNYERVHSATPDTEERHKEHLEDPVAQHQCAVEASDPAADDIVADQDIVYPATPIQFDTADNIPAGQTLVHGKQQSKSSKSLGRVDNGKIQKTKAKTKAKPHSTLQTSDLAFMEWKRLKEAEDLEAMQSFQKSLDAKESTINALRQQNETLSEGLLRFDSQNKSLQFDLKTKQALLKEHQEKIYKFAQYMSSLDKDIPAMRTQQQTINRQLRKHLTTDHEVLRNEIADSRASIDRIRIISEGIVKDLQAEIANALQQTQELRKQLGDNAGQLAEERDRSMRFEKQLKLANDYKTSITKELAKMRAQFDAFGSAMSSVAKQAVSVPTNSDDQTLIDAANADTAATSEKLNSKLTELQGTIKQLYESHQERLDELKKHQESLVSAESPLEQRLNEAIDKISRTLGEMQTLQERNESLCAENAKFSQQVVEKDGRLSDLVKERDSLISIRTLLEEKAHKAAEDLAVIQERMLGLANQKPVTGDELQAALLRGENLALKGELELLKESRQREGSAHQNLLQQIETLKKQLGESEEKFIDLESTHAQAVEATTKEHHESIEKVKQEMIRNFNAVKAQNNMNYNNEKKQFLNVKSNLEAKLKDAESELEELRAKVNGLEQNASIRDADKQLLQEQQEQDRRAIAQLKEQIKALQDEIAQLTKSSQEQTTRQAQLNKANEEHKKAEAVNLKQIETLRAKLSALETASAQAQDEKTTSDQEFSSVRQELRKLKDERQNMLQAKHNAEMELKETQTAQQQEALAAKLVLDKLRQDKDDENSKLQDEIARLQSLLQSRQEVGRKDATGTASRTSIQKSKPSKLPADARSEAAQASRHSSGVAATSQKRGTGQLGSPQNESQSVAERADTQRTASQQPMVQVVDSQRLTQRLGGLATRDESPDGTFDGLADYAPEALESSRHHVPDTQSTFVPPRTFGDINNRPHQSSTPLSEPRDDPTPPSSQRQGRRPSGINDFAHPGLRHGNSQAETPQSSGSRADSRQTASKERPRSNTGNKLTPRAASVQFTQDLPAFSSSLAQSTQRSTQDQTQNTQNNATKDAYSYEMPRTPSHLKPSLKRKPTMAPQTSDKRPKTTQDSESSTASSIQTPNTPARAPQKAASGKKTAKSSQAGQRPAPKPMSKVRSSTPGASQPLNRASTTNVNVTTRATSRTSSYDFHTSLE